MNRHAANLLLYPYYYGSYPMRWWSNMRRDAAGRAPVTVVFYHRVADQHPSPWSISTRRFAQQITWLRRHFTLVSLEDAQARIRSGNNTHPAVSITFDDGYADNCAFALPLLIRQRVPFTYFVSLHHIQHAVPFTHDIVADQRHRVNTVDELRALANEGVEIGVHTRTHADLGQVRDADQLYDEVVTAGRELSELVQRPMRYFAFPYGLHRNLTAESFCVAREAGYRGVCSAYGGYNFPGDDPFHLQRFHADEEWIRWKHCMTIDPRRIRKTRRFDYSLEPLTTRLLPAADGVAEDERTSDELSIHSQCS